VIADIVGLAAIAALKKGHFEHGRKKI